MAAAVDPDFEALLEFVRDNRHFDFTGYKRASLQRRIRRRMQQVGVGTFAEYGDYLQFNADEFVALFNTILINVTSFFRDPDAWDYLRTRVLPELLAAKRASETIRVWSAGTANGAEAYTAAMVLAEEMGALQFRDRVKIYATDVDEEALAVARQGVYTAREVSGVPAELRDRYFEAAGDGYAFRKDLRRCLIFGRNDLVQDAPISRVDLLACRNTLMYFTAEMQDRILSRFHFALTGHGVLFLGKAETLLSHSRLFSQVDARRRIFRRVAAPTPLGRPPDHHGEGGQLAAGPLPLQALDASPQAILVIAPDGVLARMNRLARELFGLTDADLGRPIRELDASLRPVDLRPLLDRVGREQEATALSDIAWARGERTVYLNLIVAPLPAEDGPSGAAIYYSDVTEVHRLQADLGYANRQLETSYEELQSTVEELETTNEELQSTVEELETTNEELQSTNDELETTNEELQSTNDELQSANEELSERGAEVATANAFMDSILRSLDAAVVTVDAQLLVTAWSTRAEHLWGLRSAEAVGGHLADLDIGLPVEQLYPEIRQVLAGTAAQRTVELPAVNRRGRPIITRVRISRLGDRDGELTGAILLIEAEGAPPGGPAAADR